MSRNYPFTYYMGETGTTIEGTAQLEACAHCGGLGLEVENTHTPCFTIRCECGAEFTGESAEELKGTPHHRYKEALRRTIAGWNRRYVEVRVVSIQQQILSEIAAERGRQDARWGIQDHPSPAWTAILGEEFGEVSKAVVEATFTHNIKALPSLEAHLEMELVQVAAVCVAWIEAITRRRVEGKVR